MLAVAGVLLVPLAAPAQAIRGVVVEAESRRPIAGALVELCGQDTVPLARALSDSVGVFLLGAGRAGDFTLRLRRVALPATDPVTVRLEPGDTLEIELRVAPRTVTLEPLVVTAERDQQIAGFYERLRRRGFGHFLSREDIEERRIGPHVSELLRTLPGVQVVPGSLGAGLGDDLIVMRGPVGSCLPTIYIDGMPVAQHAGGGVDAMLTPDMLEGVEVYTTAGTAPATIHARGTCGVVAFWTRRGEGGRWNWTKFVAAAGVLGLLLLLLH